jgi:hypothetical protein
VLGDLFTLCVPHRRSVHPVTGGNWEGVGIVPDIDVEAADSEASDLGYDLAKKELSIGN